jgi:hypothetical protein
MTEYGPHYGTGKIGTSRDSFTSERHYKENLKHSDGSEKRKEIEE